MIFLFFCLLRTDSVSLNQEGELESSILYDVLPSSCPDHPVVSSNAFHAADIHQEEGKTIDHTFLTQGTLLCPSLSFIA